MGQFLLPFILAVVPFEKYSLGNGLEVILHQDHRLPIVAVNVMYHVGAFDEPRGRTGFAHLFEHLMFQGSRHVGDDEHMRILTEAGAVTFNAYTSFDHTEYLETVPANELELVLWLESDRMGYLLDTLDIARLDTQRDVVKNERRQVFENAPYGMTLELLLQALYPPSHPYHDGVIGSMAHLSQASLEDATQFFKTYYTPANATIVLSGDFDAAQAKAWVSKYFGGLRGGPKPKKQAVAVPLKPAKQRVLMDEPLGQSVRVNMAWVTPPAFGKYHAELDTAAEILAGGKGSRLYRALVLDQHMAQNVSADVEGLSGGSMFSIDATAYPDVTAEQLEKAMTEALAKALATPATEEELRRVKAVYETRVMLALESIGGDHGRANVLQTYNHYTGDPGFLEQDVAAHRGVTAAGMQKAVAEYLTPERRVTLIAVPKARTDAVPTDAPMELKMINTSSGLDAAPWRAQRPSSGPKPRVDLPVLQKAVLPNGLTVLVGEAHTLPLVSVGVHFRAGAAFDPVGKDGLAHFMVDLLDEGAAGKSAVQLDEAFQELGCDAESGVTRDGAVYQTVTLKQNAAPVLQLLADIVRRPDFAAREVDDVRVRRVDHYYELMADATSIGLDRLMRAMSGAEHPYGHPQSGTPESLAAITRDDVVRFHATHVTPERSAIVFVGDVTLAEAKALAEKAFGDWKRGGLVPVRTAKVTPGPSLIGVRMANVPQNFIALGVRTVAAGHPDEHAVDLVNSLYGGEFNSRLNMRLREELAISYGAQSLHDQNKGGGVFVALSSVHAEAKVDALGEMTRSWEELQKKPVTDAELAASKSAYARSLTGQFEHLESIAGAAGAVWLDDLPLDYFKKKLSLMEAVTTRDARRVVGKYLKNPKRVIVGESKAAGVVWEDPPRKPKKM